MANRFSPLLKPQTFTYPFVWVLIDERHTIMQSVNKQKITRSDLCVCSYQGCSRSCVCQLELPVTCPYLILVIATLFGLRTKCGVTQ